MAIRCSLFLAALLATGCPDPNGGGDEQQQLLTALDGAFEDLVFHSAADPDSVPTNIKYISLAQGAEVPAEIKNTTEWDIALEARGSFFYISTNSGETASGLGSGGQGGVWFTNKSYWVEVVMLDDWVTDFSEDNAEYEIYVTDVTRYQPNMTGVSPGPMNIMTYYGYEAGDGLSPETPFTISTNAPYAVPFFKFNKKAFAYSETGMPPPWRPTMQVYIIKHADGSGYSKFQVHEFSYKTGYTYTISFKFETLIE
jgi:hypothetical protein